jgi:hypothetical protein
MGQGMSASSLSCVDCGSRLVTQEDNETFSRIISRDIICSPNDDYNDEVTVFESPVKAHKKYPHAEPETAKDSTRIESIHPNTSPDFSFSGMGSKKNSMNKTSDDYTGSEISTPTQAPNSSFSIGRYKTLSRNFSSMSLNLVDAVRKSRAIAYDDTSENIN